MSGYPAGRPATVTIPSAKSWVPLLCGLPTICASPARRRLRAG